MAQSVTTMLKDGQEYMKTWPLRKELYALFPDCRVVAATRFAIKVMPPLAVLACASIINVMGSEHIPQAIAIGAFFPEYAYARFTVAWASFKPNIASGNSILVSGDPFENA